MSCRACLIWPQEKVNIHSGHGLVPHPAASGGGGGGAAAAAEGQQQWSEAVVAAGYRHLARQSGADMSRAGGHPWLDFALVGWCQSETRVETAWSRRLKPQYDKLLSSLGQISTRAPTPWWRDCSTSTSGGAFFTRWRGPLRGCSGRSCRI